MMMSDRRLTGCRVRILVSGVPRGYHFARPDGNWLQEEHRRQILAVSPDLELLEVSADRVATPDLQGVEVALAEGGNRKHYPGELDWEDYQRLFVPTLRWVQLCSTGFSDNITPEVLAGHVALTNAPGLHTVAIAESVMAAMLGHAKRLAVRRRDQVRRAWEQVACDEVYGRTALIIGLGRIGRRVAQLCQAFGMTVIGTRRNPEPLDQVDKVFAVDELGEHLGFADYVVIAAPLTPETHGLLGAEQFALMRPSAYLINVGRGSVADERAMLEALRSGQMAGAYLDVFADEPLPPGHELWAMDNVLVVPHDSHSSPRIGDRMVEIFCDNLRRYLGGEPLLNICDPGRGY